MFTITNPAPIAQDDALTAPEDGVSTGSVFPDNGSGIDNDPDGDVITVSEVAGDPVSVGMPTAGSTGGLFTINPDGSYSFDPGDDFNGLGLGQTQDTTITYQISDGEGGFDDAVVTVTVQGANDGPIPVDPTQPLIDPLNPPAGTPFDPQTPFMPPLDPLDYIPGQTGQDAGLVTPFDLTPFFGDPDAPDAVTLSVTAGDLPVGLTFDPLTNTISGTPSSNASQLGDPGTPGVYTIPVTATDPNGAMFTTNVVYTITNPAPIANDDAATGDEDNVVTGNVINDAGGVDVDGGSDNDTLNVSQVGGDTVNVGQPITGSTGGLFTINPDGSYSFDPNEQFEDLAIGDTRDTTVEYQISDGQGGFDTAILTMTVTGVNDAPVVSGPAIPQSVDDGQTVPPVDTSTLFSDVDGNVLTFSVTDLPTGLSIDPVTGIISGVIDPSASQGGDDPINAPGVYTATVTGDDGNGGFVTTTVTYTVTNVVPIVIGDLPDLTQHDADDISIDAAECV